MSALAVGAIVVGAAVVVALAVLLFVGQSPLPSTRLGRFARIGRMGARLSASWLGAGLRRLFAGREGRARIDAARREAQARVVAETMGHMKGAFMKLGQMMSFVSEAMPAEFRATLASLQAQAPPMDFALIRDVAERELGRPLERAFARFDPRPLASASIGQVHRARLPSGEEVVVKVQYPGVAQAIQADLDHVGVLYSMMGMLYPNLDPKPVVDELRARIGEELDYRREAANQRAFAEVYTGHPFIRVPRVYASHSTERVLTTEYVAGRRWDDIVGADEATRQRVAEILYRFAFGSILRFGVFNGDPHPGNYLFDDEGRVVFLDFGCVKYFPDAMRREWRGLVRAHFSEDRARFRRQAVALGFLKEESPLDADTVYEYFSYFYEPFRADRTFTFTPEYTAKSLKMVFAPEGRFAGIQKQFNMPRDFVFVNRIQWGVYSLLTTLRATGNWHRIHRELLFHDPPSTELGRLDHEYRLRWAAARGWEPTADLQLAPDGVRRIRLEA